jgi:hypothetical protein
MKDLKFMIASLIVQFVLSIQSQLYISPGDCFCYITISMCYREREQNSDEQQMCSSLFILFFSSPVIYRA